VTELRLPKPARRSPKARKPIRGSGIANKGKRTSRRRKARKASKALCDRLWSELIRRQGRCVFEGQILSRGIDDDDWPDLAPLEPGWANHPHVCVGPLQAMHGIPKGPYPSARYKLWNGFTGCSGAHVYYTHRPELWVLWLQSRWGDALYAERLRAANYPAKHDYEQVAEHLREAPGEPR
jgi:hypothetical protein